MLPRETIGQGEREKERERERERERQTALPLIGRDHQNFIGMEKKIGHGSPVLNAFIETLFT